MAAMGRRAFLKTVSAGGLAIAGGAMGGLGGVAALVRSASAAPAAEPDAAQLARKLPRWRGFNLLEKFNVGRNQPFVEDDFRWMADWGFDFVRLPMDYRCWTDANDPYRLDEKVLAEVDQAVEFGRKHGVHVSLNLHRAPGYTVAKPPERLNLWKDEEAQRQFDFQWAALAKRYRGVPAARLSFNLVNEPANVENAVYARIARRAVEAIRREDPDRLIISDGNRWGNEPIFELRDLGIAQSTRGYQPFTLTHYQASWVNSRGWPEPTWPLRVNGAVRDRQWLRTECIEPWKKLAAEGVGVHVGEWGCYNKTPHAVVLAWARDLLELWKEAGFGWALWNFRGSFGILDSDRTDVDYEDFRGHKLDRKLLGLLLQG